MTEPNYKAMLVELLAEIAAYDKGRGAAEERWYNWRIAKEHGKQSKIWAALEEEAEALLKEKP